MFMDSKLSKQLTFCLHLRSFKRRLLHNQQALVLPIEPHCGFPKTSVSIKVTARFELCFGLRKIGARFHSIFKKLVPKVWRMRPFQLAVDQLPAANLGVSQ